MAQEVTAVTCILETPGSNLGDVTDYPEKSYLVAET